MAIPHHEKVWQLAAPDTTHVLTLRDALGTNDDLFARLFVNRGILDFQEARDFLNPSHDQLHDPMLMKGMPLAVDRLIRAFNNNERIMVYGDYDVDGTTAVSLVYGVLSEKHANMDYYIPDRYKEGYGISAQGMHFAKDTGCSVVIALDCGIKAHGAITTANTLGLDVIVCDHHLPGKDLPPAYAILDPKQSDCPYPFKELSGCGIGYKLLQAIGAQVGWPPEVLWYWLDLVAISTACDIVPMLGENRVLTALGLEKMQKNPLPGVAALLRGVNPADSQTTSAPLRQLTVSDLVFKIGPKINAAGRMEDAKQAVRLLLGGDKQVISNQANLLHVHNNDRKQLDKEITEEAIALLENDPDFDQKRSIVVYNEGWHKGVIGIVASRLVDRFYKPTVVLTMSEGKLAGSARSVHGFSIYDALLASAEHLEQFGGHKYAAGMQLMPDKLTAFTVAFEAAVAGSIRPESLRPVVDIEAVLSFDRIPMKRNGPDSSFWRNLSRFAPFGPGNKRPVFTTKHVRSNGYAKEVGDGHLRCTLRDGMGIEHTAIGWGLAHKLDMLKAGPVDICYTIDENEYKGYRNLQLELKDIKPSNV